MQKSTQDRDCTSYYRAAEGRPPRPTLLRALARASSPAAPPGRRAIDLGCGTGRDALPLLANGWQVLAVDSGAGALAALRQATPTAFLPRLVTRRAKLETAVLPPAELVNASFCLFFLDREAQLRDLVARIHVALVPGGRFAGHLLGPRDSWVRSGCTLGSSRAELDVLFRGFTFERLEDEENDGVTPKGEAKHWHVWHINAVKPRHRSRRAALRVSWRRS